MEEMQPQIRRKLYEKAAREKIPIRGTFELTSRCNMNCKMCYVKNTGVKSCGESMEYTAEQWIELGRKCKDAGMLFLLLTGGEPFLRKDFQKIYKEINRMGVLISINSNGTMITEETLRWLKECPPMKINITLYGASNHTYEKLCGNPKGYDQVSKAIDLLIEAGIPVGISASFTPLNIGDMEAIYAFAKDRSIPVKTNIYMFPPVRKEGVPVEEPFRLSAEEAGKALYLSKKYQMEENQFQFYINCINKGGRILRDPEECMYLCDEKMGCDAGSSSFWITWDGKMLPCGLMNYPIAEPFVDGFEECWKKITQGVEQILLPSECTLCNKRSVCNVCGAMTIAEGNGDAKKKPEYVCKMAETFMNYCSMGKGEP